jgi:hypothetical protein
VLENQGIESDFVSLSSAPSSLAEDQTWTAAGKPIGRVRMYFDGSRGGQETTFGQDANYSGEELDRISRKAAFHAILDARKLYSQVEVDRAEPLDGEEAFVLKLTPKSGPPEFLFVSSRTSLILKEQTEGETTLYGDFRHVDGEVIPFRTTIHDALGETTVVVQSVRFDAEITPDSFAPRKH